MNTEKVKALSAKYLAEMIRLRREIHQHPETSFEEVTTSRLVCETLEKLGIPFKSGIAKTGVLAQIDGKPGGKTVLLRADMDALNMPEEADVPYKSQIPGKMHACGHDGHTATLLGVAMILNELKDEFTGTVKLMFQPAEEAIGGALPMIEAGILENPKVDAAFGCHLNGTVPEGSAYIKKGAMMASPTSFTFTVKGKGGHAAYPNGVVDPVVITAQIICAMQTIVSRSVSPLEPAVISCSMINGGTSHNIIPDFVTVTGTIRTLSDEMSDFIPKRMEEILDGFTRAHGATYELNVVKTYPVLVNDDAMVELARKSISKILGEDKVIEGTVPVMGGEDFSYLCKNVPSCFINVGIHKDEPILFHNPKFKWDDSNLEVSGKVMAQLALDFLAD